MRAMLLFLPFAVAQAASAQMLPMASAELGPAPVLQPGASTQSFVPEASPAAAAAISVNPANRYEVSLLYRNVYVAEDSLTNGWNGSVSPCNAGATAQAYQNATLERVNVFRALAGLPGNIAAFSATTDQTDDQQAALMMAANRQLSHAPPSSWTCYTAAGFTGAGKSNLALGEGAGFNYNGPTAIEGYMEDDGSSTDPSANNEVGHRRWILYPPQLNMADGDVDSVAATSYWSSDALWVFGPYGSRPSTPNGIAWPPRSYVPWQLLPSISNRWSLSLQNANFNSAGVAMTRNGVALATPVIDPPQDNGQPGGSYIGDNTLVWEPTTGSVTYTQPVQDVVYHVSVTGITGTGVPTSVSYNVTVIDPYDAIFADGFDGD